MWSCNEQRFWHGLPSDEHRPVLYPNTAVSSEKEINKEFQVRWGVNKQDGSLLADDFLSFSFFTFCRCKVHSSASAGSSQWSCVTASSAVSWEQ